jgi:2-phospho-L-lactate guanylyltransferase (CobY/MobA/RfbA family)
MPTMQVFVVVPDNDRLRGSHRITVRTTTSSIPADCLVGPERQIAVIPADLSLKAARQVARWYQEHKDDPDREDGPNE